MPKKDVYRVRVAPADRAALEHCQGDITFYDLDKTAGNMPVFIVKVKSGTLPDFPFPAQLEPLKLEGPGPMWAIQEAGYRGIFVWPLTAGDRDHFAGQLVHRRDFPTEETVQAFRVQNVAEMLAVRLRAEQKTAAPATLDRAGLALIRIQAAGWGGAAVHAGYLPSEFSGCLLDGEGMTLRRTLLGRYYPTLDEVYEALAELAETRSATVLGRHT